MRYESFVLSIVSTLVFCFSSYAQNAVYKDYLARTGEYSGIYSGQVRVNYNRFYYYNMPYYYPDYTDADVVYNGNMYAGQRVLLDLYREQAIILSPEKKIGVVLDAEKTDSIRFRNAVFIWMNPLQESGLKKGYFRLIHSGMQIRLLCKEKYFVDVVKPYFYLTKNYYICLNNQFYPVKNKKSFIQLFPEYKKLINRYDKQVKTNFKKNTDISMLQLAAYCEELLQSEKQP
jgi:hypothetical protein